MFGARIRQLRRERHLTQVEVAAAAGITQSYLSDLERELEKNPSREVIQALAKVFGIPVKELAGAIWLEESPSGLDLSLETIPEPLARVLQRVGSLLDEDSWKLVAAYVEGIAAERSRNSSEITSGHNYDPAPAGEGKTRDSSIDSSS